MRCRPSINSWNVSRLILRVGAGCNGCQQCAKVRETLRYAGMHARQLLRRDERRAIQVPPRASSALRLGRSSYRRRAEAGRGLACSAPAAARHGRALSRPCNGQTSRWRAVAPHHGRRTHDRAQLCRSARARRLPPRPLLASEHACPLDRGGGRRRRARTRHDGHRRTHRAGSEPGVRSPRAGARGAVPSARVANPARGTGSARVRAARRPPACAPARRRAASRSRLFRAMVRRVAVEAASERKRGCQSYLSPARVHGS